MDALAVFIPLLPLLAALLLGMGHFFGLLQGEAKESLVADISLWLMTLTCLMAFTLWGADSLGQNTGSYLLGDWLRSDTWAIPINFISTGLHVRLAALFALLLAVIMRFSVAYLHREAGYFRFFFAYNLFAFAMLWLALSGNAAMAFMGWEIAGLCSFLLIAYRYDRPEATANATRVFITNRIGDAGFLIGIGLSFYSLNTCNWLDLTHPAEALDEGIATGIASCFVIAAFAKSAQLPFSPWLARAMEGPTPSSAVFYGAVMIHAGVFLVLVLQGLLEQAPWVMGLLVVIGFLTALYSYLAGLTQTDIKSSLVFATTGQLGLMFMECGLGWWTLASLHLAGHAIVRGYQVLTAPSILYNVPDNPIQPIPRLVAQSHWLYLASLQRFWLDAMADWGLVKPTQQLAHDLSYFDDHYLDKLMTVSSPAINAIAGLAQLKEQSIGARLDNELDDFGHGSGLAGALTRWTAATLHWLEEHLVLRGISKATLGRSRALGRTANQIERSVLQPRFLVLFVFITLLVTF